MTVTGLLLLLVLLTWSLIWKGFGLWYSAKKGNKIWFVVILIINSAGIIPIIYLAWKTDFFHKRIKKASKKKSRKKK